MFIILNFCQSSYIFRTPLNKQIAYHLAVYLATTINVTETFWQPRSVALAL